MVRLFILSLLATYSSVSVAGDPPSIGGSAKISANIMGAVVNGGVAEGGAKVNLKQSVASVLHGSVGGTLKLSVEVKGMVANAGMAEGGAEVTACQSVGSIGSDC